MCQWPYKTLSSLEHKRDEIRHVKKIMQTWQIMQFSVDNQARWTFYGSWRQSKVYECKISVLFS